MLIIRDQQLDAFKDAAIKDFESRMLKHLLEFFPNNCALMSESQVNKLIGLSQVRAEKYGLTNEKEVCLFLNLMCFLGSGFDVDPQFTFLTNTLVDVSPIESLTRLENLYDKTMVYIDRVGGRNGQFFKQALSLWLGPWPTPRHEDLRECMLVWFQKIWPQKYFRIGNKLNALVQHAVETANRTGITGPQAEVAFCAVMYIFGSEFVDDPQFLWAESLLSFAELEDPVIQAGKIEHIARQYVERWLHDTCK